MVALMPTEPNRKPHAGGLVVDALQAVLPVLGCLAPWLPGLQGLQAKSADWRHHLPAPLNHQQRRALTAL